ncbi:hypothetical protein DPW02_11640 [Aggregatibacter aphrophilus]|nr:hypothetical protein DPW02_11640 [Aggregatibacter aphrophilus]
MRIKEIEAKVIKNRIKLYEQAFGVKTNDVSDIIVNDDIRVIFREYMDFVFAIDEKDLDLAIKQFVHAISQPSPRDQFFEALTFLRIIYEWDIYDMQFEYLSDITPSDFLDKLK